MEDNIQTYTNKVIDKLQSWLETIVTMLPNFLIAIIIILLTVFVAKIVRNFTSRMMNRITKNIAMNRLTASITFFLVLTIGMFISLRVLNLDKTLTSLLAGLGIAGLALGFAFKDIASNFIAGIYLALKSPINVGDIVDYQGAMGHVKEIGLRSSTIKTFQGQDVVIPNRMIMEEKYTHYSINGERRIDLEVGISYGDDLEKVEKVVLSAINKITFINKTKPVDLYFNAFGDSSIVFSVRYWVKYMPNDHIIYLKAVSEGIKNIKAAFDKNDITIPFPIRTLDFGIKGGKTLTEVLPAENEN